MTEHRNLYLDQGSDFTAVFTVLDDGGPRSMLGWTGHAAVRRGAGTDLLCEPTLTLQTGRVTLVIPGKVSAAWTWRDAHYEILLLGPRGRRERLAAGRLTVNPSLVHLDGG